MILDCLGERCPRPIITLARAARGAAPGLVITLHTDDPAAIVDIPAWCRMRGHGCRRLDDDARGAVHEVTIAQR